MLSIERYAVQRIYHRCEVLLEKSVICMTVGHFLAGLVNAKHRALDKTECLMIIRDNSC